MLPASLFSLASLSSVKSRVFALRAAALILGTLVDEDARVKRNKDTSAEDEDEEEDDDEEVGATSDKDASIKDEDDEEDDAEDDEEVGATSDFFNANDEDEEA